MCQMSERTHKRTRYTIISEILQKAEDGTRKTRIMYDCNLNYTQTNRYLEALKKTGFINEKSGIWKTTEKGLHVIEACKLCRSLMESVS